MKDTKISNIDSDLTDMNVYINKFSSDIDEFLTYIRMIKSFWPKGNEDAAADLVNQKHELDDINTNITATSQNLSNIFAGYDEQDNFQF